jgi:hypothetical protein
MRFLGIGARSTDATAWKTITFILSSLGFLIKAAIKCLPEDELVEHKRD